MLVLGIDTTGAYCSAAIINPEKTIAYKSEKIDKGHSERLAPMVAELIKVQTFASTILKKFLYVRALVASRVCVPPLLLHAA